MNNIINIVNSIVHVYLSLSSETHNDSVYWCAELGKWVKPQQLYPVLFEAIACFPSDDRL